MLAEERRTKILDLINHDNSVKVKELCDKFEVSGSTIRRDLKKLEDRELIARTHGGAVAKEDSNLEPSFMEKEHEHTQAKSLIGKKAAELVDDGDTIILDAGTTTTEMAKSLTEHQDLTIVTNGVNIALELADSSHEVILPGGNLKKNTLALVGPATENYLQHLHADKVFLGANGIDLETGVTTPDLVEANVKGKMASKAKEVIVLADKSKFEQVTLVKVLDIANVSKIITNTEIDREILNKFATVTDIQLAGEVK
ncbi:DeoR/GlpR family DNA-binding transcription regulator [Halanaerocella petrolearia]